MSFVRSAGNEVRKSLDVKKTFLRGKSDCLRRMLGIWLYCNCRLGLFSFWLVFVFVVVIYLISTPVSYFMLLLFLLQFFYSQASIFLIFVWVFQEVWLVRLRVFQFCDLRYVDAQTSSIVGLGINVFPAYVYIIFVCRVVYVDMSTRSSQLNHLSLESWILLLAEILILRQRDGIKGR